GAPAAETRIRRAGRDLTILVLAREPDFDVIAFGRAEPDVARAALHHPVREFETLQDRFGIANHGFELLIATRGRRDLHQLDLVELMVAEDALHVLAVGAGLAPIARREGRVFPRQRLLREHFAAVERGQG